jgi:hypothetical protein
MRGTGCREEDEEEDEEERRKERTVRCLVLTDFCRLIPPDPPWYCIRTGSFFGLISSASILRQGIYSN